MHYARFSRLLRGSTGLTRLAQPISHICRLSPRLAPSQAALVSHRTIDPSLFKHREHQPRPGFWWPRLIACSVAMSSIVASSSVQSITHASLKVISFAPTAAIARPSSRSIGTKDPGSSRKSSACCSHAQYQPWAAQAWRLEVKGEHPGKMSFTRARADGGAPVASEKFRTEVIFFSFRIGLAETGSPRTGREASLLPAWRPS